MKKHSIILLIAILYSHIGFTQGYTPYTFENFETEWTHHAYNEDLLDKKINAYYLEDIVTTDTAIYTVYSISSMEWYYNGFLLEKLDAETGALLWEYTYFQESDDKREMPSRISLRDDNTLVLSSFRELDEEDEPPVWYTSQMNNWVFDTSTGALLDTLTTINGDPDHVPMVMNVNFFIHHLLQNIVSEYNGTYQYLQSTRDYTNIKILDYTLNELGHPIAVDSVFLPIKYSNVDRSYTTRLDENKIFNFRKSFDPNHPQDSFNIEITHLDSNLNVLYTKNISDDFFGEDHFLYQVNKSRFTVIHLGDYIFEDQPYRHARLYAYDLEGNLLEEAALEKQDGSPLYSVRGFNVLPIEELNQTLLVFFNETETEAYWEWFLTTPYGGVEQIGKTVLDNVHDAFAWTFLNLRYAKYLGDGKILLYALHLSEEGSNNTTGTFIPSLCLVSLDRLRTTVAIENIETNHNLVVSPNPTSSQLHISLPQELFLAPYNINIFNTLGQRVLQMDEVQEPTIDVENLTNGVYILSVTTEEGRSYYTKFEKL